MTNLDYEGRRLLDALQQRCGVERFQDVEPATGSDEQSGLTLTMDAARRIVGVRVPDASSLRAPDTFADAVAAAFARADLARETTSREKSGTLPPPDSGADLDISSLLGPADAEPRGIVAQAVRRIESDQSPRTRALPSRRGRSDNGYLEVVLGARHELETLSADETWLAGAREEHLEKALVEAFRLAKEQDA